MQELLQNYLDCHIRQFEFYKLQAEKAMKQVSDDQLFVTLNEESNSIAMIVQHLWGNMMSRWTDFLNSDGEKPSRQRDAEFEFVVKTRAEMMDRWNQGWTLLLDTLNSLKTDDLGKPVYIRNMEHTVLEAVSRQLAHYCSHVGQIIFLSKYFANTRWQTLSIPRNGTRAYNENKFSVPPHKEHFTDEHLKKS
ncbi:MAG TPA: DUF1572 family protein [Saprospiraceae bacterium]|nr:DUF1572 family protein [Saprospiraceae bacterium]